MRLSFASLLPRRDHGWKSTYSLCGLATCRNRQKTLSGKDRAGISIAEVWYCGVDCFAIAARKRFQESLGANVLEMPHVPRRPIGLMLLSKGILTSEQLQSALDESRRSGEELEATLLRVGLATERHLAIARAAQWGCPVLGQDGLSRRVEVEIPPTLLEAYSAVPVHASVAAKRLLLGFVYRVEHSLLNSLEQMTGLRAEPCFITAAERREQARRLTQHVSREEIVFDNPFTPAEMATNVAGFALEVGASEARFAHCRNFAWTRLTGRQTTLDVLFRIRGAKQAQQRERPVEPLRLRAIG
jgi:hypothetical protein